jgi:hypothetical protein
MDSVTVVGWAMPTPEHAADITKSTIFVSTCRVVKVSPVKYLEAMPIINLSSFVTVRTGKRLLGSQSHLGK